VVNLNVVKSVLDCLKLKYVVKKDVFGATAEATQIFVGTRATRF